jgi:UPF0271 protein
MNNIIDINCDLGEGNGNEALLMPFISSCNIACAAHAGDKNLIDKTIKLAIQNNTKVGAHPSFPDRENFGRKVMDISSDQLEQSLINQINLVKNIANKNGSILNHIKFHGALYNLTATNVDMAQLVVNILKKYLKKTCLYVPYHSVIHDIALKNNLKFKIEAFADRNYNSDLTLVSRDDPSALITDKDDLVIHLLQMVIEHKLIALDGEVIRMEADTFCIHGDNPNASEILPFITKKLLEKGIKIE